ncbi:hypothetical protein Syun_024102 [Stephania yunnanensis]|uniref:Uncharacterized protein n=1 Tax=Stephania yunnanensis TaxID=152371 RepID=A0AAP0I3P9_9MAGN
MTRKLLREGERAAGRKQEKIYEGNNGGRPEFFLKRRGKPRGYVTCYYFC